MRNLEAVMQNSVPREFKHYVLFTRDSSKLHALFRLYPNQDGMEYIYDFDKSTIIPQTGPIVFHDIAAWIENDRTKEHGFVKLWFKCHEDINTISSRSDEYEKATFKKEPCRLYKMDDCGRWRSADKYEMKDRTNYVGFSSYADVIQKDINNLEKHNAYLKQKGEVKTLNYLLYGPPGCGKTTLGLILANENKCPIYMMSTFSKATASMSPVGGQGETMKIILFEDFDRYLSGTVPGDETGKVISNTGYMSDVLNSLDGVNSGQNIIRLFTANDPAIILSNAALKNRMSGFFKFSMPTKEMFMNKLQSLAPQGQDLVNDTQIHAIIDKIVGKLTLRPFVNYVIRHMFDDNFVEKLTSNLDDLLADQQEFLK